MSDLNEIVEQRGKIYGDAFDTHSGIGQAWGAQVARYLEIPPFVLPARVVALMMASLKLIRAGGPWDTPCSPDSYDDGEVYIRFARDFDQRPTVSADVPVAIPDGPGVQPSSLPPKWPEPTSPCHPSSRKAH